MPSSLHKGLFCQVNCSPKSSCLVHSLLILSFRNRISHKTSSSLHMRARFARPSSLDSSDPTFVTSYQCHRNSIAGAQQLYEQFKLTRIPTSCHVCLTPLKGLEINSVSRLPICMHTSHTGSAMHNKDGDVHKEIASSSSANTSQKLMLLCDRYGCSQACRRRLHIMCQSSHYLHNCILQFSLLEIPQLDVHLEMNSPVATWAA